MKSLFAICSVFAFISGITFAAGSMDLDEYIEGIKCKTSDVKSSKRRKEFFQQLLLRMPYTSVHAIQSNC